MCETYLLISADTCVDAFTLVRTAECSQEIIVILLEWEHLIFLHRDYNWDNWRETLIYFFLSNKKPRGSSKTTDRKRALGPWNPWILQSTLGISDPRFRKSLDSSNSRIFKYSICIFFFIPFRTVESQNPRIPGIVGYQVLEPRRFLGPVRILGSHDGAREKWSLDQVSLTDRAGRRSK